MLGCKAAAPHLRESCGRTVNVSSVAAEGNAGQAAYSASKGGVLSLTATLALELGRDGVLVNAVAPWFVEGRMAGNVPERFRERTLRRSPLSRFAEPGEVASVIYFLLGLDSSCVSGQTITICGRATVGF